MRDLIDTRASFGRKDSVQGSSSSSPPDRKRRPRPNIDLGAMLYPTAVPNFQYRAIQDALHMQDKIITERNNEVQDQCDHIHRLERQLSNARWDATKFKERAERKDRQLQREQSTVDSLKNHKKNVDEKLEEQDSVITISTKLLAERKQEVDQLRTIIDEGNSTIASLNQRLLRLLMAAPHEWATVAGDEQAHRTLAWTKRLQQDVADRDAKIADYEARLQSLVAEQCTSSAQYDELRESVHTLRESAEASKKQKVEAQSIQEAQDNLIKKLLEENTRLSANAFNQ